MAVANTIGKEAPRAKSTPSGSFSHSNSVVAIMVEQAPRPIAITPSPTWNLVIWRPTRRTMPLASVAATRSESAQGMDPKASRTSYEFHTGSVSARSTVYPKLVVRAAAAAAAAYMNAATIRNKNEPNLPENSNRQRELQFQSRLRPETAEASPPRAMIQVVLADGFSWLPGTDSRMNCFHR